MIIKDICIKGLLYIISMFLISSFYINIKSFAEDISSQEPYEIWQEDSAISVIKNSEEKAIVTESDISNSQIVKQENFKFSKTDAIGLYDVTNGGFDANLWEGSNLSDIEYLINLNPINNTSLTLKNLVNKAILTVAAPPNRLNLSSSTYLDLKIDYLIRSGYYEDVSKLLNLLKGEKIREAFSDGIIDYLLIYNQHKKICSDNANLISPQLIDLYFKSFCNAMSANKLTLDLNISLMREEGRYNEEYLDLLSKIIYNDKIQIENLQDVNLINLSILQKYNIDINNYITDNSPIKNKLYYFLNYKKNSLKKISVAEELVLKGLIDHNKLAETYQSFESSSNDNLETDDLALIERIKIFNDLRKTSSQSQIVNKIPEFVDLFSMHGLLKASSLMIYDKVRIISPKLDYIAQSPDICLILILNNDSEKCNEWVNKLNFSSNQDELSKVKFYLSLANGDSLNELYLNQLINDPNLSVRQKNIIVKFSELKSNSKNINYWKTPNDLNKVSSITANIKLHNYYESLESQIGEKILLLSILHGDDDFDKNDEFSLFLIIDGLFEINEIYARDYILEYFTKYNL